MIKIDSLKITAKEIIDVKQFVLNKYKINPEDLKGFIILKKSLDARDKNDIVYIYSIALSLSDNIEKKLIKNNKNISCYEFLEYKLPEKKNGNKPRVIVVGFGPAGLFAAYLLALQGYNPTVIERGSSIEERTREVEDYWNGKVSLNPESNVQFGEGGAGTFSDGKLNTGVKDKEGRIDYILKTFVKYGAKDNIIYDSKPHVGTDVLAKVVKSMREQIISLGGRIYFNTRFDKVNLSGNSVKSIECYSYLNDTVITMECDKLILALGHSSRDTNRYLSGLLNMEQKPFAMGFRVIHKQDLINTSQYGKDYNIKYKNLPECSYKLTYQTKDNRGVYSFCMCPGGYVVNASSEGNRICVNGMSYNDRASGYANSAIIVQISPKDLSSDDVLAGMYLQEQVENKAYIKGNGSIPVSRLKDMDKDLCKFKTLEFDPAEAIKGQFTYSDLKDIFPSDVTEAFMEGMKYFENKIHGFATSNPYLSGVEARTSSPVKIIRDDTYQANISGIYPCGEGAGYAGGIISAAIDGMKIAEQIIKE